MIVYIYAGCYNKKVKPDTMIIAWEERMDHSKEIAAAKEHFGKILTEQSERIDRLKSEGDFPAGDRKSVV